MQRSWSSGPGRNQHEPDDRTRSDQDHSACHRTPGFRTRCGGASVTLHPQGRTPVATFLLLALVSGWGVVSVGNWFWLPTLLFAFLGLFLAWFFRDPERHSDAAPGAVLSGADGRVIQIRQLESCAWFEGPAVQVSVFMSPLNVHVNRASLAGTVVRVEYRPGAYLMAFNEKSSELNEASTLVLDVLDSRGMPRRIAQTQIAGFLARRIVGWVQPGQSLARGERYGMIKLGSRMDHFLPADARIQVNLGDRVLAGNTQIGELP
ncbi:MAG: phosphatidylserine decarboxylase family protein [Candidatus Delongbacteria bacterium]|nr:phosphatidylserine decarboxylase family protein [Candidatus Cloacimonadota bacterium]MCA9787792.1 phosphatidylserine decarboxylase family protein [Candidatus Cloacimonadota bacterium]MCB9472411.1 phosphatidylserine decarboxylase family protein [Candidatus Delongbacteria bacterium]